MNDDRLQGRLLVLDDDKTIAAIICTVVGRFGFEARAVHRADAFFDLLEQWEPSHVMVDLVMPDRNGVEVVVELAERGFTGQVILVSGLGARSLEVAGRTVLECGLNFAGVVSKPFTPATLRTVLTRNPDATS